MRKSQLLKSVIPLGMMLLLAGAARADFNPVPLTPGSFTADVVVEAAGPPTINNYVTATMDGGTNNSGNTWFEQGYEVTRPWSGLPVHNSTFAAADGSAHQFHMAADYTANNALCVYSNFINGNPAGFPQATLTLTTPAAFISLSVVDSTTGGPRTITYTIHYAGGGTQSGTLTVNDWFNTAATTVAWYSSGRVSASSGNIDNMSSPGTGSPRLFYDDIFLSDTVNNVESVEFATTSGERTVIFALSGSTDGINYTPIAITGLNRDMIIEVGAPPTSSVFGATTATLDAGTNNWDYTFYEIGFAPPPFGPGNITGTGLPHPGTGFTVGNHTFTMAPSYTANNAVLLDSTVTTASLTLTTPATYAGLSFLNSCGGGSALINVTVHHADSSTDNVSFTAQDWFNSATAAYANGGRFRGRDRDIQITPTGSKLWLSDAAISSASPVTSLDLTFAGTGGHAAIFAIAGSDGVNYNPIAVTGYNYDVIVEASQPRYPVTDYAAVSVSMDGGTNKNGNTWYERGYYHQFPNSGLPSAGSTITSVSLPDHHYQLPASYSANNAVFVDYAHATANLTLVTPAKYSGVSFLSSCANGRVTNACLVQFADGTSESHNFISLNWHDNTPFAFSAYGRVDCNTRGINNDPGRNGPPGNPRLYEAQFGLVNQASEVTNLVLQFLGAENATSGRMVVMAVSATAGALPPLIAPGTPSSLKALEGTAAVLTATITGGGLPMDFQWYVGTNGVWAPLSDGGFVSGSGAASLTNSSIGLTNAADYQLVAHNAGGYSTSAVATVTVLSGLPDVAQPGDPMTGNNWNGPNEGLDRVFDHTTSKGLNNLAGGWPISFTITPSLGKTTVSVLRFYTANDAEGRDPASYSLEGSNDSGATYSLISSNGLALPGGRNGGDQAINPLTQNLQEVRFANATGYKTYRVSFWNNKGDGLLQIGEVEILGVQTPYAPIITMEPVANVTAYVGAAPTFTVAADGFPANLAYQWYLGGTTPIPGATSARYTLPNAQMSDSGKTFSCTITNLYGPAYSTTATLTVVDAPTEAYPVTIMADQPLGYWRLGEGPDDTLGNNGVVATDYYGGHNGIYSNVTLALPGCAVADPNTATKFGYVNDSGAVTADSFAGQIPGVDFAKPTNNNVAFTVEAWVQGAPGAVQLYDAGIVAKGYGSGGEQFDLDCGNTGNHLFRFLVRDAAGNAFGAGSSIGPDDSWHHLVGVVDQANSNLLLYVDGQLSGSATIPAYSGLLQATEPLSIGSRRSDSSSAYNNQFYGKVDEVAVYGYALSSTQVLNHFYAAGIAPRFTGQPTNTSVSEGATANLYAPAYGTPTLYAQWYQSADGGVNFAPLSGQTSTTLTLANVPAAYNGYQYYLQVTNAYGATNSDVATLFVVSGPPVLVVDIPSEILVYAGQTVSLPTAFGGTPPISYQWYRNSAPLANGGRISGAQSNVLTIINAQVGDIGSYQVQATSPSGGPTPSTAATLHVETIPDFNANGLGWTAQGSPTPPIVDDVLTLTSGATDQRGSAFYKFPLYVGAFVAGFTYQDVGIGGADGFAFVMQNDPRGPAALGGGGGGLGFDGISPSAALTFNIYGTAGYSFGINGANGSPYQRSDPVGIAGGNPINIGVLYLGGVLSLSITDVVVGVSFHTNMAVNLPAIVGAESAYVGLTGASGGVASHQTVSNFRFIPLAMLSAQRTSTNTVVLSWPASIGGYAVLQKADLSSGTWTPSPAPVTQAGGFNHAVIFAPTGAEFYQLKLQTSEP